MLRQGTSPINSPLGWFPFQDTHEIAVTADKSLEHPLRARLPHRAARPSHPCNSAQFCISPPTISDIRHFDIARIGLNHSQRAAAPRSVDTTTTDSGHHPQHTQNTRIDTDPSSHQLRSPQDCPTTQEGNSKPASPANCCHLRCRTNLQNPPKTTLKTQSTTTNTPTEQTGSRLWRPA